MKEGSKDLLYRADRHVDRHNLGVPEVRGRKFLRLPQKGPIQCVDARFV